MNSQRSYLGTPLGLSLLLAGVAFLSGCTKSKDAPAPSAPPSNTGAESTPAPAGEEQDPIKAVLAKLSPEDRALVEKQVNCPVSDAALGSMGAPLKISVKGRDVFLCCEHCKGEIEAKPDEFLAKLDKAKSQAADSNGKTPE